VAAIAPALVGKNAAWVGWSGFDNPSVEPIVLEEFTVFPVPLSRKLIDGHYNGFSNKTLWPLFHHVGASHEIRRQWWDAYCQVNRDFAEQVSRLVSAGGMVWVHDYQVMVLPQMIKSLRPDVAVGYFHHIPFPPAEILDLLPQAQQIVMGLASADLVGFQRESDSINFRDALAVHSKVNRTQWPTVRTYPISIDFPSFSKQASQPEIVLGARGRRQMWGNPQNVLLGVDRLDYTKGIPERLEAYGALLDSGEISAQETVFVQAGSPSRENVDAYVSLQETVEALVERINSRHSSKDGNPAVWYLAENLDREDMLALFVAADVMVVSSLRDGMNLVAKEYVACKTDNQGVLVLSIHTGAADRMTDAILVDPTNPTALQRALLEALNMPPEEAEARMRRLREQVRQHDVARWATEFLTDLASPPTQ